MVRLLSCVASLKVTYIKKSTLPTNYEFVSTLETNYIDHILYQINRFLNKVIINTTLWYVYGIFFLYIFLLYIRYIIFLLIYVYITNLYNFSCIILDLNVYISKYCFDHS